MSPREITYLVEFAVMLVVWLANGITYQIMTKGNWRRTPEGRHVMLLVVILVWFALLIGANLLFHEYPGRIVIGAISYGLPSLYGMQRLVMIVKAQRAKIRREREIMAVRDRL